VIVAAPAYEWDEGKHYGDVFKPDHQQFPQDARWVRAVAGLRPSGLPSHGTATDEEAALWFLERLYRNQDPRTHPARRRYLPGAAWRARLEHLESTGLITWQGGLLVLTESGRDRIQRALYVDVDGPERLPFVVLDGPMASGSAVMMDPDVWDRLEVTQRRLLALEMEAATVATVATTGRCRTGWSQGRDGPRRLRQGRPLQALRRQGVRRGALRAARRAAVTRGRVTAPGPAAGGIPGQVKVEIIRRLTYDWQDLADVVGVPRTRRTGSAPATSQGTVDLAGDRGRLAELAGRAWTRSAGATWPACCDRTSERLRSARGP
jgi:hypothetical protein